jgi:hypothetical protein
MVGVCPVVTAGQAASAAASVGDGPRCSGATSASIYSRRPSAWLRHASKVAVRESVVPLDASCNAL